MSSDYYASDAITISVENMVKILPEQMKCFLEVLEKHNTSIDEWAQCFVNDDYDSISKEATSEIYPIYKTIEVAFDKITSAVDGKGMSCLMCYHNKDDNGSRYDDVNGAFFWIFDTWEWTPAANLFKEYLDKSNWVEYG